MLIILRRTTAHPGLPSLGITGPGETTDLGLESLGVRVRTLLYLTRVEPLELQEGLYEGGGRHLEH